MGTVGSEIESTGYREGIGYSLLKTLKVENGKWDY